MFINNEDPFWATDHEPTFKIKVINQNSTLHSHKNSIQRTTLNFDSSFTDFTQTVSKCLQKGKYPPNLIYFNPFCPVCSKFVRQNDTFTICKIKHSQTFLIHDKCLITHPTFQMNVITDQQDNSLVFKNNTLKQKVEASKHSKSLSLQYRQFLIQIIFFHPISEKKFGKIQKKQKISKSNSILESKFSSIQQQNQFSPNKVVLPLTDYQVQIGIYQIGEEFNKQKLKRYINFKKLISKNTNYIIFGNQQLQFQLRIQSKIEEKQTILEELNYKYGFPVQQLDLLIINRLWIQLPDNFKESSSQQYDELIQSNSSKLLQFLEIDSKLQDEKSLTSRKLSHYSASQSVNQKKDYSKMETENKRNKTNYIQKDCQKVNLEKLMKSDNLKDFVRNNTQSRSFQSFLQKANNQEIDKIIEHLKGEFSDLMKHEYGNYMMQKLFLVCNLQRRIKIVQILISQLSEIITNKQGTHAFQQFLSVFVSQQQYYLTLNKIRQNFFQLCTHNNATHFIQKVVKIFPIQMLNQFYFYCVQNLYQFACDKNGMCVLKHMFKKLNQISQKQREIGYSQERYKQLQNFVGQYKKLFAQATLYNLDAIIGDMYGNYVVQFNFDFFGSNYTSNLTDSILMKLPQYSLSKYSTNVVFRCLNIYWIENREYVSNVLKECFQAYLILQMYKNKDGNKILLELMEKYEGFEVWNRVYNILITTQPARYYHDRWGTCLGSRSGTVGCKWKAKQQKKKQQILLIMSIMARSSTITITILHN